MNLLHLCAALALIIFTAVQAQQPAAPVPTQLPGPDPKLIKEYESILKQKFTRDPGELLRHLERVGTADPATLPANDRFLMRFVTGDWAKVGQELKLMPPELAVQIYNKMLSDLTENRKPAVRLDDIIGLSEAAPAELTNDNVRRLGQLLGIAVPMSEIFWLTDRFQKGTGQFGGTDPAKRLLAARVLMAGNFRDLARDYLPGNDAITQIADEGVRNELMNFVATQEQRESTQRSEVQKIWDENIRELLAPATGKNRNSEQQRAISNLSKVITQVPPGTLAPVFTELVKTNPETAMKLLTALARKIQNDRNGEVLTRTTNITVQANVAALLCDLVKPGEQPWTQVIELMADVWASEAENTFTQKSATSNQQKFILPEDLMPHAPTGKWAAALTASSRDRMDVAISRLILTGANFDQAAERIVEIGKRSARAGAALAEDFLGVWAKTHNPQIPEQLRRKFNLPDDARIPVTPIMMEKNIESLARMMALFRQAGIAPADYSKVVEAFDLAYSNAETYRTTHIEKVFGPMDKMDEPLFFLILSRMSKNLGERWRKMDVQTAGMTQRDEQQTLDLVREGYGTALKLIDGWIADHGDSSRALTLAGTLLVEWGDFEYFQELVASDSRMRMVGYKEKNLQAQDYFNRGAVAYGKQVAKLAPDDYSVDAYLGWFNGLLGISSNGQINLSKAMNRAALTRIREHLVALPGKASKAHISMFAKIVNDRLADEKDPLHEDLKYRYLASSLVITKDDPFTLGAQKLVHTEAMGRAAHFGQYLTNDANAGLVKQQKKPSALVKKMRAAQGPRDELELNITEALAPFFDIKSITFATPDIKPRPTAQAGWDETVLAYLHVRAKDASVDKIPPVQLELKFVDLSGPITIPAESAETVIKVATDKIEPRPANNIEITQTLDNRQLNINGALTLEVKATASGLVPELEQLLDMKAANAIAVKNVNPHEGLQITELNTWADQVAPKSERVWTISLDGDQVRASETPITFSFPQPKAKDAKVVNESYTDMNLTTLKEPVVQVGRTMTAKEVAIVAAKSPYLWPSIIGGAVLALALILWLALRGKGKIERPLRARDVFTMPKEVDGFAVVALLRRLCSSPLVKLKETQQSELQTDLKRVEAACFGSSAGAMSETDLRAIASKWLRSAT
ncbi:MAG: hypothetical protein NTV80_17810 [Verrucomicrobia bacterium]|nr:hypothetical protein [Verrucomicrobiota bacterium]